MQMEYIIGSNVYSPNYTLNSFNVYDCFYLDLEYVFPLVL